MGKKILVIGGGGREHAIIWKLAQSPAVDTIYAAPGNGGIASLATCVTLDISKHDQLIQFVKKHHINYTIVGPEAPLVDGLADLFYHENLPIFGPDKIAAQLEGSKAFSKDFMSKYGIPTARYELFSDSFTAIEALPRFSFPVVVKASGLAAGKGVIIAQNHSEAESAICDMLDNNQFGQAGSTIVVEEFLQGLEMSVFVITDGKNYQILPTAQDHKRAYDNDKGPNTGGMGAYSPSVLESPELMSRIEQSVIIPTVQGILEEGGRYTGIIYFGLMICGSVPKLLEYNCRFGDPEAQVIIPRVENDLDELIEAAISGNLHQVNINLKPEAALTVVVASEGYPGSYEKGKIIHGLNELSHNILAFHAGTTLLNSQLVTHGGRVLALTVLADDLFKARKIVYDELPKIQFNGAFYRCDIGEKALKYKADYE